ncbi:hypothetical protein SLS60_003412 [Paraconiothyrium brasiliense]|uniref:Uncharacterized protein n=1 Tax=Paraconiothyrium brasiliense TaxID=300254 RepID=A0ABR3RVL9_9PLEO
MHTKWPILDRMVYEKVYERQYDQASLPVVERCTLHLIYAISGRFLQLTKQQGVDVDPEAHFAAAIEQMDYIMERHNTLTVQFLALLAIYGQRSPYGADHDINVELPSSDVAFRDLTSTHSSADHGPCQSNIIPFIHDIRLRKLQSKIQRTVFRVDLDQNSYSPEDKACEDAEVEAIRHQLDIVIRAIMEPKPSRNLGRDLDMLIEPATSKFGTPNQADPLLGAVKDVFMEVDEDVPGGGQGWRLFTEMVQSDIQVPELMAGERSKAAATTNNNFLTSYWSNLEQGGPGDQGAWDHEIFAGYD